MGTGGPDQLSDLSEVTQPVPLAQRVCPSHAVLPPGSLEDGVSTLHEGREGVRPGFDFCVIDVRRPDPTGRRSPDTSGTPSRRGRERKREVYEALVVDSNPGTAGVRKGPRLILGAPSNPVSSSVPRPAPLSCVALW